MPILTISSLDIIHSIKLSCQVPGVVEAIATQKIIASSAKDFRPEIAAAVFAATGSEILKPITTPKGVYLIWIEEIIQPQLDEQLRQKIITHLFDAWLKQQIQFMEIVTLLDSDDNYQQSNAIVRQA